MTEHMALAARIFADDPKVWADVTSDEIRRYCELEREAQLRREHEARQQREREQILATAREAREREERESLRGVNLITRALQGA
jgi:prephenate dehydrogenase